MSYCPCGKKIYPSRKQAQKARNFAPGRHLLSVYRCRLNGAWHLGNKPIWKGEVNATRHH